MLHGRDPLRKLRPLNMELPTLRAASRRMSPVFIPCPYPRAPGVRVSVKGMPVPMDKRRRNHEILDII